MTADLLLMYPFNLFDLGLRKGCRRRWADRWNRDNGDRAAWLAAVKARLATRGVREMYFPGPFPGGSANWPA